MGLHINAMKDFFLFGNGLYSLELIQSFVEPNHVKRFKKFVTTHMGTGPKQYQQLVSIGYGRGEIM